MPTKFTETQFKQQIQKILLKEYPGIYYRKLSDRFRPGILDTVICWQGRTIWIENKVLPNLPTPLQLNEIKAIKAAGGEAYVLFASDSHYQLWTGEPFNRNDLVFFPVYLTIEAAFGKGGLGL